jgi:hypothetical protein
MLPTGLLAIFLGLLIVVLVDAGAKRDVGTSIAIVLSLVTGSAIIGVALWRRASPGKPLFTLSPAGIHYRIPGVKDFLIPWREIQGVDTIDIVTSGWSPPVWLFVDNWYYRPRTLAAGNVTVVLLSRQFYDSHIFVRSFLLRGPGWKANFIPKGELVQVALHHTLVAVEPRALRQAVEARWHAFRDQTAGEPTRTSVPAAGHSSAQMKPASYVAPKSNVVAMGDNPRAMSRWEAVKIIVPLIGIAFMLANLVGLWQLPGQGALARAKAGDERKYWEECAVMSAPGAAARLIR